MADGRLQPLERSCAHFPAMIGDLAAISAGKRLMGKPRFGGRRRLCEEKLLLLAVEKMIEVRQGAAPLKASGSAHGLSVWTNACGKFRPMAQAIA